MQIFNSEEIYLQTNYIIKFAIKTVKFALNLLLYFTFELYSMDCFCFSENRKRWFFSGFPHFLRSTAYFWAKRSQKAHKLLDFLFLKLLQPAIYQRFWPLISGTQKAHKFLKNRYFSLDSCVLLWYNKSTKTKVYQRFWGFLM